MELSAKAAGQSGPMHERSEREPETARNDRRKDVPLEALRGLAALAVVAWHLIYGFFPAYTGVYPDMVPQHPINGRAWFGLVNGLAAVDFFFVLSGFVLTRRALATGDDVSLVRGAVKRWPRLAGPITLTVLLSYALLRLGAYDFVQAGALTRSPWLSTFANVVDVPTETSVLGPLKKGVYSVLFRGHFAYDSSLWTMPIEFRGSLLALGLALALVQLRRAPPLVSVFLGALTTLLLWEGSDAYLTFAAGVLLAAFTVRHPIRVSLPVAGALCGIGIYLCGYFDGRGDYHWLLALSRGRLSPSDVHLVGALALIVAVEGSARLRRALSGAWAAFLGEMSFPIYLVHVLMICSIGAAVFVQLDGALPSPWPGVCACVASVLSTLAVALPLAWFDKWWMRQVNQAARWAVPRGAALTPGR